VEVVVDDVGVVDGGVDVADGGCAGVVGSDMVGDGDGREVETVQQGVGSDGLGDSVDVPAFFSRRGSSSWGAVCVTASVVEMGVVWVRAFVVTLVVGTVCTPSLSRFVSHFSRSAVLPRSSPSFSPLSYPSLFPSNLPASSWVSCVSSSIGP
jgi:hypothetical protein